MQPILADTKQEDPVLGFQFEGTAKDEDADVPLAPTKPSASSMKPVEKASPLELSTEERDLFSKLRNELLRSKADLCLCARS